MAEIIGSKTVSDGLIFLVDSNNHKSVTDGSTWTDIIGKRVGVLSGSAAFAGEHMSLPGATENNIDFGTDELVASDAAFTFSSWVKLDSFDDAFGGRLSVL